MVTGTPTSASIIHSDNMAFTMCIMVQAMAVRTIVHRLLLLGLLEQPFVI